MAELPQSPALKVGPQGLVFEAPPKWPNLSVPFRLTTEAIAIGQFWSPATTAGVNVEVSPKALWRQFPPPAVYARYGPDARHWSPWHPLALGATWSCPTGLPCDSYGGDLAVASPDMTDFDARCREYERTTHPSQEGQPEEPPNAEACAQSIVKSQPDFFAEHLPFIGYVQLLYETELHGGEHLKSLDVYISWVDARPNNGPQPEASVSPTIRWRFRAQ